MNSKLKVLVSVTAMSFVMVGCGGSSDSGSGGGVTPAPSEPSPAMMEKDHIEIIYNSEADRCENMKQNFAPYPEYIFREATTTIRCADYGRVVSFFPYLDSPSCQEMDLQEHGLPATDIACVMGWDEKSE